MVWLIDGGALVLLAVITCAALYFGRDSEGE